MQAPVDPTLPSEAPATSISKARWIIVALAFVCLLPLLAALVFRFVLPPAPPSLVGKQLEPSLFPFESVQQMDGQPYVLPKVSGQWLVVHSGVAACDSPCRDALYLTRQARTAQGKNMERVQRIWVVLDDGTPAAELLAAHPDLLLLKVRDKDKAWPFANKPSAAVEAIQLVDRRGFTVFQYESSVNPVMFIKELGKLIRF